MMFQSSKHVKYLKWEGGCVVKKNEYLPPKTDSQTGNVTFIRITNHIETRKYFQILERKVDYTVKKHKYEIIECYVKKHCSMSKK